MERWRNQYARVDQRATRGTHTPKRWESEVHAESLEFGYSITSTLYGLNMGPR